LITVPSLVERGKNLNEKNEIFQKLVETILEEGSNMMREIWLNMLFDNWTSYFRENQSRATN